MGEFEALFPVDRLYADNHMWAMPGENNRVRFGLEFDAPKTLEKSEEIGAVESKKAESSLYSPLSGTLTEFNADLLDDPSAINLDKYGKGWLFEIESNDQSALLTPQQYVDLLADVWDKTQKTIKGQLNS